ncbi:hypothetical protein SP99_04520 [Enterobacter sp. BIDMC92]|nr:hypothetical protein SP99_04520 [Enterobacter sp. BIDMC92]
MTRYRTPMVSLPFSNMHPHAPEQVIITLFVTHYGFPHEERHQKWR